MWYNIQVDSNLKLYSSKVRKVVDFRPLDKSGKCVKMYVCGPTVQSSPHIGHMRASVAFDVLRRFFSALGFNIQFVQNITDINDKIWTNASNAGVHWQVLAKKYEAEFMNAYNKLNVLLPTAVPHASEYISEQIELIKILLERGYAYRGIDSDVWFNTEAWKDYGELTNQENIDNLSGSEEDFRAAKKNQRDFALWKTPKSSDPEDARWESPWGSGHPGWHLECSAMSGSILGDAFDIHGGGLDLRFPHHENELAQSRAAGRDFANLWMHSAWVTAKGEKMSKSLGNGLSVDDVLNSSKSSALALRYALATVHYRSMLEWTDETLESSRTATTRLKTQFSILDDALEEQGLCGLLDTRTIENIPLGDFIEFLDCMNEDLNVSAAIACIWQKLKTARTLLSTASYKDAFNCALLARKALDILGIDPFSTAWLEEKSQIPDELREQVEKLISNRTAAKKRKDFEEADKIRNELLNLGIEVEDGVNGSTWKVLDR
ncbi:MAG: cysteine--tRNA ligase [Candidatus Ancillula sp.]|jgi:cysteinyl-tRNA synthetase|nr:cysteine--tRNA ligase [Candidatus Ancillula sp.]